MFGERKYFDLTDAGVRVLGSFDIFALSDPQNALPITYARPAPDTPTWELRRSRTGQDGGRVPGCCDQDRTS